MYTKPSLTRLGTVAQLTKGNQGSGTEAGPNARQRNNPRPRPTSSSS